MISQVDIKYTGSERWVSDFFLTTELAEYLGTLVYFYIM